MAILPYDVWLHIVSFLSKRELWNLRFLNKAMYEMAMDCAHKEVVVALSEHTDSKHYRRDFLRFRDPNLSRRVRDISFVYYDSIQFRLSERMLRTYPPKMGMKERFQHFLKGKDDKTLVVETLTGFTRVQSLNLEYTNHWDIRILQDSTPLIRAITHSSASSLQSLSFSIPFENLEAIIPPSLFLPNLSSISMTIFGLGGTAQSKIGGMFAHTAQTIMVPLINRHRQTLTSLCLRLRQPTFFWSMVTHDIPTNFDISPIYRGLKHIPHLKSLGLSISSPNLNLVVPFVELHANTIRNLTIYMTDPVFQSADIVFDLLRPKLTRLDHLEAFAIEYVDIPHSDPTQDLGSTPNFIVDHSPSLTSLKLSDKQLTRDAVFAFLKPQGRTLLPGSYERVKIMKMALHSLTPELLTLFEYTLPNLEDLKLSIRKFKRRHTSPEDMNEEYQFFLEIGQHDYSHWNLISLSLSINDGKNGDHKQRVQKSYGALALARALTSLQRFNELPRRLYISQACKSIDPAGLALLL